MAVCCLEPATGEIDIVLAGHPVPLLLGPSGALPAPLSPSPPIGVRGVAYRSAQLSLAPGEGLVLYSDGLVERRDEDLSESVQHFAEHIDRLGRTAGADSVFDAHRDADAGDDRTVVVLRRDQ
jgi:serine phosphatase RsbU (regulator of sigma subunit)